MPLDATTYRRDDIEGIDPPALLMWDQNNPDAWILSTAFIDFADIPGPKSKHRDMETD